jgi:RimJ/RimL family protein N-acetyltransferase
MSSIVKPDRWTFRQAEDRAVRAFLAWRYESPYDIYNPDPENLEQDIQYLTLPQTACYVLQDVGGEILAYCTFGPDGQVPGGDYSDEALDIGLGVRPDLTGQGQGRVFVTAVLDFAKHTFAPEQLRVTIAEFNTRALRVWTKAGFRPVQVFDRTPDGRRFVVCVREA